MSKAGKILELDPPGKLTFQGPFDKEITSYLKLTNVSNRTVGYKLKSNPAALKAYHVTRDSGSIPPAGSVVIPVTLKPLEISVDRAMKEHKFKIQSAFVSEDETAVGQILKKIPEAELMESKLGVILLQPLMDREKIPVQQMEIEHSEESLQLSIIEAVWAIGNISFDQLLVRLFNKHESDDISATLKNYVRYNYVNQLKGFVRHHAKKYIFEQLNRGSSEFIKHFEEQRTSQKFGNIFAKNAVLQSRMNNLLAEMAESSLFREFSRYFDKMLNRFAPPQAEQQFYFSLVEFFVSGEMTLTLRDQLNKWRMTGSKLSTFKALLTASGEEQIDQVVAAATAIKTDEFIDHKKVLDVVDKFLAPPEFIISDKKALLKGRHIFLSEWQEKFMETIGRCNITAVEIYANDCCTIDCDLYLPEVNFVICTKKVYLVDECKINLSGKGYRPGNTKAKNAETHSNPGIDGADGHAGGSSGNCHLFAQEVINPGKLKVYLNGGRGEDGGDGGDGFNGKDGVGITQKELDQLCVKYTSIYWKAWDHFFNYSPPADWSRKFYEKSSMKEFIYSRYEDKSGRELTFSLAADKGWLYTTYDLYFMVEGSCGSTGSQGGSNGIGGDGGYWGNFRAENPETGEMFPIQCERVMGEAGKNGKVGISGRCGINGNDMVMIDRSTTAAAKFYIGSDKTKLSISYEYEAAEKNCLSGGRKHVDGKSACFARWSTTAIDTTERRVQAAVKRTESTRKQSKAVAKQLVFVEDVLSKLAQIFEDGESFLADTSRKTTAIEDQELEEESVENITEEVNILKQRDEKSTVSNYTPETDKKPRPVWTPESFLKNVKKYGRFATAGHCSQLMFDLFEIEIPAKLLDSIKFHTLFQKNAFYHAVNDNKFSLAVIAAVQDRLANGKSYNEIVSFSKDITSRRRRKYKFATFCLKLQNCAGINFMEKFEQIQCQPDMNLKLGSKNLFGVAKVDKGMPYDEEMIEKEITNFFKDYSKFAANIDLLVLLNDFINGISPNDRNLLATFGSEIDWTDQKAFATHMQEYKAWFEEEIMREKSKKSKDSSKMKTDSTTESTEFPENTTKESTAEASIKIEEFSKIPPSREKTPKEMEFGNFLDKFIKDQQHWVSVLHQIFEFIEKDKNLKAYFGEVPKLPEQKNWLEKKWDSLSGHSEMKNFLKPAEYVIRFYFLSEKILTFMRHLYNCNELFVIEISGSHQNDVTYVDDGADVTFDSFIERAQKNPLDLKNEACEEYMLKNGLGCSSVRYLLAHKASHNIVTYVQTGYQELTHIEYMNKSSKDQLLIWLHNGKVYGIAADKKYRDLVKAEEDMVEFFLTDLEAELSAQTYRNYRDAGVLQEFSQFYAKPFRETIIQWVEGYMAMTKDHLFLQSLHERFYIDGCHLTPFEFQFVLIAASQLLAVKRCNVKFLLLATSSVPQNEIVNVMLYLRILHLNESRYLDNAKIYHGIQLIDITSHKALFAAKLSEFGQPVDPVQMYKLILMLQHASSGSNQLKNVPLKDWIDIANKQKWSEIGAKIKQYGDIGYYLGYLDDCGKNAEEKRLRKVFDSVNFIPERIIAIIVQNIAIGEVKGSEKYFQILLDFLSSGKNFQPVEINAVKRPILITNELEQGQFLNFVLQNLGEKNFAAKLITLLPKDERTTAEMINLITGLHDETKEKREARKLETQRIGNILKAMERYSEVKTKNLKEKLPDLTEAAKILLKYDDYLFELKEKHLHSTQKMAILYAVENEKNVLEQVNTGEGKSFIITAIAIIRLKLGYKNVDIITSSPVLAKRDADEMRELYDKFALTVSHNCCEDLEERKKAYECDVVYGDMARFQRDYLLHTFYKKNILGDRTRDALIVDEVDNMLLDNGNNMLYLSHNVAGLNLLDSLLIYIHKQVNLPIYSGIKTNLEQLQEQFNSKQIKQAVMADIFGQITVEDLKKLASSKMSVESIKKSFEKLMQIEVIDDEGYLKITQVEESMKIKVHFQNDNVFLIRLEACLTMILNRQREINLPKCLRNFVKLHLDELIENCKNAMFMLPDNEYVIDVDHTGVSSFLTPLVTIIDANTGADLATSQWSGGLHQFLQLKHGCRLAPISLKAVFVSNVAYLKGYDKINGLSGTLGSVHESKTLNELYDADLIKIPTFEPKKFYEHVPVIDTSEEDWLQSLYDEVCDQLFVERSTLIICESIAQLRTIHNGLNKRYLAETETSDRLKDCFENITIYEREFQELKFKKICNCKKNEMQCSKLHCGELIIATNLAGRGTDIKLSPGLVNAGGLHVITAFLPMNFRIEEQAFGRAARCGEPGSAQIIAMKNSDDGINQPSIFQLKMFRNNKEVHRLASLKAFYDFRTNTEEECLKQFKDHSKQVLSSIYSSKNSSQEETLPTPMQVLYFALLDKWAMWLDEKLPLIKKCAENHSDSEKQEIIESVEQFLNEHTVKSGLSDFESSTKWLDFPQSLITLGIIQMSHDDGFEAAENTFNRVLKDSNEFAAEIYYYKACMWMNNWTGTRTKLDSMEIKPQKPFQSDINIAIEYFEKSRTLFANRIQYHQKEAKIVAQFLDATAPKHIKTLGFFEQFNETITIYELVVANIDWLLGIPCNPNMFVRDDIDQTYGTQIYNSFVRQGVISPVLISNYNMEKWQLDSLRHSFKLSKDDVMKLLEGMKNDPRSQTYEDFSVFDIQILGAHVNLSHRIAFWMQMKNLGVFLTPDMTERVKIEKLTDPIEEEMKMIQNIQQILVVNPDYVDKLPEKFADLKPIPEPDENMLRNQIRLSNSSDHGLMYKYEDVASFDDEYFKKNIQPMLDKGYLKEDWLGQINRNALHQIGYMDNFDGLTIEDLSNYFEVDAIPAAWILDVLCEAGSLKRQTLHMKHFTTDEELWKSKVGVYLTEDQKITNTDSENLIQKYVESLDMIRKLPILKNVTSGVIKFFCQIEEAEQLITFYKLLEAEGVLEDYQFTKFRLFGKLDCSTLPLAIAKEVDEFLSDRFAYSFALEHLCQALDESIDAPRTPKNIFLQENPQKELYDALVNLRLATPMRIFTDDQYNLEEHDYQHFQIIQNVINEHRIKLNDQTDFHLEMVHFATYLQKQGHTISIDTKVIIENGLRMVVTKREASIGWSLFNFVIDNVFNGAKAVWSGVKAVGNFFYGIGADICKWVTPFVGKVVDAFDYAAECTISAGRYVKEQVVKAVDYIAEIEIVKMATETVKDVASEIGKVAVQTAGAVKSAVITVADQTGVTAAVQAVGAAATVVAGTVATVASSAAKAVGGFAEDVGKAISETKAFQLAKEAFVAAMDAVKYAYQKMCTFVTAVSESYQYYNQTRLAARHLALEHRGMVDEHMLLRSYDGAMSEQNHQEIADEHFKKNMHKYLETLVHTWLADIKLVIEKVVEDKFPSGLQVESLNEIQEALENGTALRQLKSEASDYWCMLANVAKVTFYQLIRHFSNQPNFNLALLSLEDLPLGRMKYNFDQLEESMAMVCEEIHEIAETNNDTSSQLPDSEPILDVPPFLKDKLNNKMKSLADGIFLQPTVQLITAFLAHSLDHPQLATMATFNKEDTAIKKALADLNATIQSKKSADFLKQELHKSVYQLLNTHPRDSHLLHFGIKYCYPLPLSSAQPVAEAIQKFLASKKYSAGVILQVFNEQANFINDMPILEFATNKGAKMKMGLCYIGEMLFICQSDYLEYINLDSSLTDTIHSNGFFFEALVKALPQTKKLFPKMHESFREMLIENIS